jgi:RimJ/RimL family protein N-acetyltransferase
MSEPNQWHAVFLRGKKTILRPVTKADLPMLMRWINDPDNRQYVLNYWPQTELSEEEWLKKISTSQTDLHLVVETIDGKPIGVMGLHRIDLKNRNAVTGTIIGDQENRGQGYATDAKLTLLQYCFEELPLHRVTSYVMAFNERSLRYAGRCGYREEARLKDMHWKKGQFWDQVILVVFREDWQRVWEVYQQTGAVR